MPFGRTVWVLRECLVVKESSMGGFQTWVHAEEVMRQPLVSKKGSQTILENASTKGSQKVSSLDGHNRQSQRAWGSKKIILARTEEKTIPPRTKFSFSLEIFILGLKLSFSIEYFNPRPFFSAAREGPGMKISFSIEYFIPC